jgi:hypothetical protein
MNGAVLRVPPSAKLTVAACHVDFAALGLGADAASMISSLAKIDRIFASAQRAPQLVVFPEGADCGALRAQAALWAQQYQATTICGTGQVGNRVGGVVVRPNGPDVEFFKHNLSPYDATASQGRLVQNDAAGIELEMTCTTSSGAELVVNVRVLICYDFRFHYLDAGDFNSTQVVVVPMHDRKYDEPEKYASTLARRHYTRTFLVNKSTGGLASSAYGPLAQPFADRLSASGCKEVCSKSARLWRVSGEGVTIGDYEVGQPLAHGHDNAYGSGFFYDAKHFFF